jgi:hypothetical protein
MVLGQQLSVKKDIIPEYDRGVNFITTFLPLFGPISRSQNLRVAERVAFQKNKYDNGDAPLPINEKFWGRV